VIHVVYFVDTTKKIYGILALEESSVPYKAKTNFVNYFLVCFKKIDLSLHTYDCSQILIL